MNPDEAENQREQRRFTRKSYEKMSQKNNQGQGPERPGVFRLEEQAAPLTRVRARSAQVNLGSKNHPRP